MTVGELLRRISSEELSEWMALSQIDAEDRRDDELAAKAEAALRR